MVLRPPRSALHAVFIAAALGVGPAALADTAASKQLVAAFMHDVFVERNVAAAERYLSADYIQHNPKVAPGLAGFQQTLGAWFAKLPADFKDEVLHVVAEGDLVVVHAQVSLTDPKTGQLRSVTGFDLFRVADGKIVEHWDSEG